MTFFLLLVLSSASNLCCFPYFAPTSHLTVRIHDGDTRQLQVTDEYGAFDTSTFDVTIGKTMMEESQEFVSFFQKGVFIAQLTVIVAFLALFIGMLYYYFTRVNIFIYHTSKSDVLESALGVHYPVGGI